MSDDGTFYEDDEPIEKIRADFVSGEPVMTARPRDVNQRAAGIVGRATEASEVMDAEAESATFGAVRANASATFVSNRIVPPRQGNEFAANKLTETPERYAGSVSVS